MDSSFNKGRALPAGRQECLSGGGGMTERPSIYRSAGIYDSGLAGMKNEIGVWFVAAGLLLREISRRSGNLPFGGLERKTGYKENRKFPEIEILDLCSGPGSFPNHLSFAYPRLKAVCVDSNAKFVEEGSKRFRRWEFILGDAATIRLHRKFEYIAMSSGYHHVEDAQKPLLMRNTASHLVPGGIVLICENFLPKYNDRNGRRKAVDLFYDEFQKCKTTGELTSASALLLKEVRGSDLEQDDESKVSYEIFLKHAKAAGLTVDTDIAVWQPLAFKNSNAGTHALVLRKA